MLAADRAGALLSTHRGVLTCDYYEGGVQGVMRGWDDVAQLGKVEHAVGMSVKASVKK